MNASVEALIKPDLLIWARDSAGFTLDAAAKKIGVKREKLESWESGTSRPTINQLKKIANTYKRPLAVFYLPFPPKDFSALRDFRRLTGEVSHSASPELRFEIRQAHERRQIALELYEELNEEPPEFTATATLRENPEALALRIRELLGVQYEEQRRWRDNRIAFNQWRFAFERLGVLVLQTTTVPISEMRGFSISETPFPVVVVNNKDTLGARTFSMMHELTHIMLREDSLCDFDDSTHKPPEERRVEIFCNFVAGAILVPQHNLLSEELVKATQTVEWSDETIQDLARVYSTSKEVILRRLLIMRRTTNEFYEFKRRQYQKEIDEIREKRKKESGFVSPATKTISSAGPFFANLVLESYYNRRITASDVAEYLGVRLKHLSEIERSLFKRSA